MRLKMGGKGLGRDLGVWGGLGKEKVLAPHRHRISLKCCENEKSIRIRKGSEKKQIKE